MADKNEFSTSIAVRGCIETAQDLIDLKSLLTTTVVWNIAGASVQAPHQSLVVP